MRELNIHQKDLINRLFLSPIYKNTHPGWTSIDDLLESPSGHVYLYDEAENPFLLGFQQISERIVWLHSFYSSRIPENSSLFECWKLIPILSGKDVYAISSHRWFSEFLEKNRFITRDSIIQMQKSGLRSSSLKQWQIHRKDIEFKKVTETDIPAILQSCETSFAPLWRLHQEELHKAYKDASIALSVGVGSELAGYLFAAADAESCHILRLAVAAPFREQGFASALLSHLLSLNGENTFHTASVNTNMRNYEAVRLYKKFGFTLENINLPVYFKHFPG